MKMKRFEIYLLSRMRNADLVRSASSAAGIAPDEMLQIAREVAAGYGLNESSHWSGVYTELLGPPIHEEQLPESQASGSFKGSVRRLYQLSVWPSLLFGVNQHPWGYSWGQVFVQRAPENGPTAEEVAPWQWTSDILRNVAANSEQVEAWERAETLRLGLADRNGVVGTYLADFDFGLLQSLRPQR